MSTSRLKLISPSSTHTSGVYHHLDICNVNFARLINIADCFRDAAMLQHRYEVLPETADQTAATETDCPGRSLPYGAAEFHAAKGNLSTTGSQH